MGRLLISPNLNSKIINTMLSTHLLTPYGDYKHTAGIQRIDRRCAKELAEAFNGPLRKLHRLWAGLPVYIGHPDDEEFAGKPGHKDTTRYGHISGLEAREDGLYAQIKWSKAGLRLVADETYRHLSPRWVAAEQEKGIYRPIRLLSCGLTNSPNLPCPPLANSTGGEPKRDTAQKLAEEVSAEVARVLDRAIAEARIAPTERAEWERKLAVDFDSAAHALANQRPLLSMGSRTRGLQESRNKANKRDTFLEAVAQRSAETGESFEESWQAMKRERPTYFS